jgi:hypothetical protein
MNKQSTDLEMLFEINQHAEQMVFLLETLHSHFSYITGAEGVKNRKTTSGFYFLLENMYSTDRERDLVLDLYRNASTLEILLDKLYKDKNCFSFSKEISSFLNTSQALGKKIPNISTLICNLKENRASLSDTAVINKLFCYTESILPLMEEVESIKNSLLNEMVQSRSLYLTKEPLDFKGDLE